MTVDLAIQLLLALINQAGSISALIQKATAAGQTDLSAADVAAVIKADGDARVNLMIAITTAKAAGK
jgi:hypothetical protein